MPLLVGVVIDHDRPRRVLPRPVRVTLPRCGDGSDPILEIEGTALLKTHVRVERRHIIEQLVGEVDVDPVSTISMGVAVMLGVDDEWLVEDRAHRRPGFRKVVKNGILEEVFGVRIHLEYNEPYPF